MSSYYVKLTELLATRTPFVSVIVVDTNGSVPQDAGTKMLVTSDGLYYGTVGGGKVEKRAIEEALSLLQAGDTRRMTHFVNWSPSKDIGMTCGGQVKLFFERHYVDPWWIVVFGAGHVANALISLLVDLECRILCIDPRKEWLEKLPASNNLDIVCAQDMPAQVADLPENAFVLLITMGHSTDMPILIEILRNRQFPYLGVIGSNAKAARLKRDVIEAGLPEAKTNSFLCPIGLNLGTNHPQEIAISIVAQLLEYRDKVRQQI